MGWFDDVPDAIEVGRDNFLIAGQAIENWQSRLWGPSVDKQGDRPDPDWPATGLLLLARLQLDQVVSILMSEFGIDAHPFSGSKVSRRLHDSISSVQDGEQAVEDFAFEIEVAGEAVDLWRALRAGADRCIQHAFEFDGSITLTLGPELPELGTLGIKASDGELNVSPVEVFSAAAACTDCVAELAVRFKVWARRGYVPEPPHEDSLGQGRPWIPIQRRGPSVDRYRLPPG